MIWLAIGTAALLLFLYFLRGLSKANPARLASFTRGFAGGAMALASFYLMARGQAFIGGLLGLAAASVLGLSTARPFGGLFDALFKGGRPSASRRSIAQSGTITMELDLDSGSMEGRITAGPLAGTHLGTLSRADCLELYVACLSGDTDGARLLEPYLDRRFPGWRAAGDGDADSRRGATAGGAGMGEKEAYEVLGLAPGATREEISRAHRELMKKLHPDHGGSGYLAARVNQAKDVLLSRHH